MSYYSAERRCRHDRTATAFTLVELLTVIAIMALLSTILIPTASGARTAAVRTRTRIQFSQWAVAIEAFRQEYGGYPAFAATGKVNGAASVSPGEAHPFHDLLAGRRRDGSALPAARLDAAADPAPPEVQNFRRIPFITFTENDLFPAVGGDDTRSNLLHDGFANTDIAVLVDRNMDGLINAEDYPELPAVSPPGNGSRQLTPADQDFPGGSSGGVRAGVLFYCAPPQAVDASQLILSWR
ncbi:MAG: type II secretion system protein [Pseudomonadota bacterium]